ncbi:MAG: cupin domain-containing protein [Candidatus Rokubacteria bacterium]|nr:cupin domain-containing protein [Candidatus Rokubacteria bacterium]
MRDGIVCTKVEQLEWQILPGGFKYKFIAQGDRFLTGIGVAQPGGGESWHKHTRAVEETYYVLKGKGEISWKSDGKVHKLAFSEGDAMYLPYGIENQFVNTGDGELWLLFNITNAREMRE